MSRVILLAAAIVAIVDALSVPWRRISMSVAAREDHDDSPIEFQ